MFIGRQYELSEISDSLNDKSKAQLIIIYGRRRVGKSTLIRKSLDSRKKILWFEGIEGASTAVQIDQFLNDLSKQSGKVKLGAKNWREVFQGLGELIEKGHWHIVFDEFPWLGVGRTKIVSDLKLYWDRWAATNPNLSLFICGSVASYMVKHVIHSKALHNRKTLEICLPSLSPQETALFIKHRSHREKAQLYMCLGGIPKYLEQIDPKKSLEQNLNRHCFKPNGFFILEYETLFKEQFRSIKVYEQIIQALAESPKNLNELQDYVGVTKGGGFADQLKNLIAAQFVKEYTPISLTKVSRTRTKQYKIIDPFLIFYFRYIRLNRKVINLNRSNENLFRAIVVPSFPQFQGFAFERFCEASIQKILKLLNLSLSDILDMGPYFQQKRKEFKGVQIDWLIQRRDDTWTIIECKFHSKPLGLDIVNEVKSKALRISIPDNVSIEYVLLTNLPPNKSVLESNTFNQIITLEELLT